MSISMVNSTTPAAIAEIEVLPTLAYKLPLFITDTAVGTILMSLNSLLFAIVIYQWKVARKWPLIFGMFAANVCNGVQSFSYGIYQVITYKRKIIDDPFSNWSCMLTMVPSLWIIGVTLPATFQLLIGIERLTAIAAFHWFSLHWNSKKLWIVTAISYLCTVTTFLVPAWVTVFRNYFLTTRECFVSFVVNYNVLAAVIWYAIAASFIGVVLTVTALILGRARLAKSVELVGQSSQKFGKQVRLTGRLATLALLDLIMVTIPNLIATMTSFGIWVPAEFGLYGPTFTSIYCSINICVYVGTHKDLRTLVVQFFKRLYKPISRALFSSSRVSNGL